MFKEVEEKPEHDKAYVILQQKQGQRGGKREEQEEEDEEEERRGRRMRAKDKANAIKCYRLENLGEGYCVAKNLALPENCLAFGFLEASM